MAKENSYLDQIKKEAEELTLRRLNDDERFDAHRAKEDAINAAELKYQDTPEAELVGATHGTGETDPTAKKGPAKK
ncbi:hypothetical protein [Rathayibacter sp. VKM Ac-2805]|uniref:hypothetical protein n=1 Tax=Rathayibacter sp. VKM Ac-2805 TaxID=2609258 RepID=UPI00131F7214|nr:hypothetical protein [Rathayibacter sp. VKM Ac-2805]QHC73783.1 hypothetical protein GSU40_08900 [Rathayibacter sp. VKM Ac-2805]